jgi:transposase
MGRPTKYPEQFRRDAVELVETTDRGGGPLVEYHEGTLWNWMRDPRQKQTGDVDREVLSESERDELRRLRKKVIEFRTDKEILQRAAACFARGTTR